MVNSLDGITQRTCLVTKDDDENRAYVKVKKDDIVTDDLFYVSVYNAATSKVTNDKKVTTSWEGSFTRTLSYTDDVYAGSKYMLGGRSDRYFCNVSGTWCP